MRAQALLVSILLAGCATASEEAVQTPGTVSAPTASPDVAAGSVALHEVVAKTAVTAKTVDKFEFRLDANGAVVKQAVYHDDASSISDAVKAKVEEVFPGGTITHYETEWYADAGVVHEVEVRTADGRECEVSATPDGTLRYEECKLDLATVPTQITAAVESAYPGGKLLEVETKKGPNLDIITAEVEAGGVEYYLDMTPDGGIQSVHKRIKALVEIPVAVP